MRKEEKCVTLLILSFFTYFRFCLIGRDRFGAHAQKINFHFPEFGLEGQVCSKTQVVS